MNVTFDDTDPYLQFSPQWRVQPAPDSHFFQGTYHSCEDPGCSMSISFSGAGVYLYGSTGPNHGNYSVRVDQQIFFLSAIAPTEQYQQLLFGIALRNGDHSMVYNNTSTDPAWLDIDFIAFTQALPTNVPTQSNPGSLESTVGVPLGVSVPIGTFTTAFPSVTSTTTTSSSSPSTSSAILLGLTITFGALILLLIIGAVVFFSLARRRRARQKAEAHFRLGGRSVTPGGGGGGGGAAFYTQPNSPVSAPGSSAPLSVPMRTFSPSSGARDRDRERERERAQSPRAGATSPSVVLISRSGGGCGSDTELAYASDHDRDRGTPDSTLRGKGKEWAGSRARGTRVFPGTASPVPAPPPAPAPATSSILRRGAESIRTGIVMDDDADT